MKYLNFSTEDIIQTAKNFDVDQSQLLESFLCELLDISPDALYEELDN